jgi:transglutaminase-like putative cysteine protease
MSVDAGATPAERRYRIEHRTAYRYSDSVSASYGRGYLRPRELPWQHCQEFALTIDPAPSDAAESTDVYGNSDTYFHVTKTHTELVVTGVSVVRVRRPEFDRSAAALPWEQGGTGHGAPEDVEFLLASPYVQITEEVHAYAAVTFRPGRPALEAMMDLTHRIHADFTYKSGATKIGTPIPDLLVDREGVCQDFAHLAVACARSHGLPARYVSGYLATQPPPGRERMVGVDASHAWAAIRLPGGHWLAVDPTNDRLADECYTTVAWGRDYGDVPPLRGVIFTDAETSTMKVAVDVAPL